MTSFLKLVEIIVLMAMVLVLSRLVERYDETKLLAARIQATENDMREFRMSLNSIGTMALQNIETQKDFLQEVKDAYKPTKAGKEKITGTAGNQIKKVSPEVHQEGEAKTQGEIR